MPSEIDWIEKRRRKINVLLNKNLSAEANRVQLPATADDDLMSNENQQENIEHVQVRQRKMNDILKKVSPLDLNGNLSENWRRFKRNFDIFMAAAELNAKGDEIKVNILLNTIGEDAVEVFYSFTMTDDEKKGLCNRSESIRRFL